MFAAWIGLVPRGPSGGRDNAQKNPLGLHAARGAVWRRATGAAPLRHR